MSKLRRCPTCETFFPVDDNPPCPHCTCLAWVSSLSKWERVRLAWKVLSGRWLLPEHEPTAS